MRNLHIAFAAIAILALGASSSLAADTDQGATQTQQTAPAAAAPVAQVAPAATTVAAKDPKAIVCKRMAPETGTRLGSRMQCMTNAQWDEITRQSQEAIQRQQRSGATMADSPG